MQISPTCGLIFFLLLLNASSYLKNVDRYIIKRKNPHNSKIHNIWVFIFLNALYVRSFICILYFFLVKMGLPCSACMLFCVFTDKLDIAA
jgi:hypothetical protein